MYACVAVMACNRGVCCADCIAWYGLGATATSCNNLEITWSPLAGSEKGFNVFNTLSSCVNPSLSTWGSWASICQSQIHLKVSSITQTRQSTTACGYYLNYYLQYCSIRSLSPKDGCFLTYCWAYMPPGEVYYLLPDGNFDSLKRDYIPFLYKTLILQKITTLFMFFLIFTDMFQWI